MKMSTSGMQHRIDRAITAGWLERSDVAGSIRVTVAAGNAVDMLVAGSRQHVELVVTSEGEVLDAIVKEPKGRVRL